MSNGPELDGTVDRQRWMDLLAEAAVSCRPRMFAIHGMHRRGDGDSILGWGLEFPNGDGTIFTDPAHRSVHHSDTAEGVLRVLSIIADVHLTWLEEE
jgi:hypothetical protein